jgi:hypothetical protein
MIDVEANKDLARSGLKPAPTGKCPNCRPGFYNPGAMNLERLLKNQSMLKATTLRQ